MSDTKKLILITVSGPDKPGITSALTNIIAKSDTEIVDMGQSVTHGLLSLSILINSQSQNAPLLKDLLFEAKAQGLELEFKIVDPKEAGGANDNDVFILSCVTEQNIAAGFIAELSEMLASFDINIARIDNITKKFDSIEITTIAKSGTDWNEIKKALISIGDKHRTDIAFLKDNVYRRSKRLIVFDMDSTLIQTEVIDEMAKVHGVGDEIKAITEKAMNGELDFGESLVERVSKLKGLEVDKLEAILNDLPLTPGVEEFISTVKQLGYKIAVISGGFTYFTDAIKQKLGLDYAFANQLEVSDNKLTGKVIGTIITPEQKALLLDLISQQENISLEQVVAIGDGANDLPMLAKAGLGIAFHAKKVVRENAEQRMSHGPMTSILYFLGIPGADAV